MPLMVSQSFFVPGSQLLRWSSHFSCLCSLVFVPISLLRSAILVYAGSSLRSLSRYSISLTVSVGIEFKTFGILPDGMLFLAALLMTCLKNFSERWTLLLVGAVEKIFSVWAVKLAQSAFLKFIKVLFGALVFLTSVVMLMRRGRWSDPREVSTDQAHVGRRSADAIERSGAVLLVPVTLVGWFSFKIPRLVSPIQSAIILPLASSVSSVYHKWWWPLVSPSMRRDSPSPSVRLLTGGVYPWSQLLAGGI